MKREQFIQTLRQHLAHLPVSEVNDIVRDQEEFLQDAMSAGRTEEQAVASLGDPKVFASSISAESKIKRAQQSSTLSQQVSQTFGAVFAILALAPLNIIFVLGPFLFLSAMVFAGWAASFGIFIAAWAFLLGFVFKLAFVGVGFWIHASSFFFVVGWIGVSLLMFASMYAVTSFFAKGVLAYLKWNINFISTRAPKAAAGQR